jgi:HD-GYP domain-containing protein (c-di-GMP phosphodiesterase class II)
LAAVWTGEGRMTSILIWGRARDLVVGELPASIKVEEVEALADLQLQVDNGSGALVLADPARVAMDWKPLAAWLDNGGRQRALVVAAASADEAEAILERFPFLDDILVKPVTAARLRLRLQRSLDTIHSRRVIQQLDAALCRKSQELHELNKIGVALSAERDMTKLLELILAKSREITAADAGSLYLVEPASENEPASLTFELTQNDSLVAPFEKKKMPLNESSIAGYAAVSGQGVNVADAYNLPPGSPFQVSRSFDESSGYRTKSMLVVPMRDHQDAVIGVVQLINKKRDPNMVLRPVGLTEEMVVPFTSVDEELVTSLASQAAVALENTRLIQDIRRLFEAFVNASVTAIESRDPTTSGHSGRVAILTVGIAEQVDRLDSGRFRDVRFTRDQIKEIRYAGLLHDFGKVGVREKVLIKGKKLYVGEQLLIRQRFAYIKRTLESEYLRNKLERVQSGRAAAEELLCLDQQYQQRQEEIDQILQMILQANEPTVLEEESFRALMDLPNRVFHDIDGSPQPFLSPNEVALLSIRRGSLSEKERREIESHVSHTYRFLSRIPWTGEFSRIPEIAYGHHEKLDGSGYPRGLNANEIPIQSKMMAIADIYDALVAWDRPYKKAVPVERALRILHEEASDGKLDSELLEIFVGARIFERTLPKPGDDPPPTF